MMNWLNKIKCKILGHRYATITIHNLDKHKREYWYQCIRCGHRSRFSNLRDTIINKLIESNYESKNQGQH